MMKQQLLTDYLQMAELDKELRSKTKILQEEMNRWLIQIKEIIGDKLEDVVKSTFPVHEAKWRNTNRFSLTGNYIREYHSIEYNFRVDEFMIEKIKHDFPNMKLNTKRKHSLKICFMYDIIQNKISIDLDFYHFPNLFDDDDFNDAIYKWIWYCQESFKGNKNISFDEALLKISEIRKLFDQYLGFITIEKLSK